MSDRAEPASLQEPNAHAATDPARVFISYASPDAAVATALVVALERHEVACWIAPRDVDAGALYADAIVRAISAAKAFILVLSESAIASSHVGKEVERASAKKRPIFALRIDAASLTPALEYFLSESQWVEAPAGSMESAYVKLIGAIRRSGTAAPGGIRPVAQSAGAVPAARPGGRLTRLLLPAGLVILLALAALLADKFWLSRYSTPEHAVVPAASGPAAVRAVDANMAEKSIAVLPFSDMSEKHDQEYVGDGMAEEILDLLTKIPGLTVIGRTSSFQFKGRNEDLRTIGTKLNAAHVLEGSVRKSGEQVRITAQLINTRTGAHEWSETYDRHIGDVLKLQDAIAASVVRELQLTVSSADLYSASTLKNSDAYDLILRGRYAFDRWNKEGVDEAATLFQQALERDPTSAEAAAELAKTYVMEVIVGSLLPADGFEKARSAATNALALDPKNALAHVAMNWIHVNYDWDWAGAERELQQAATLAPGNADVLKGEAELSATLGRWDDALRQIKSAIAQDPLETANNQVLMSIQLFRGHLPEAEAAARRVLDVRPDSASGHLYLGYVLLERNERDAALAEMQQETTDDGKLQGLALVYHALGRKAESDAALARLIKGYAANDACSIAEVYAFRGQSDEAMHWLERAYVQKDPVVTGIKGDTLLKNLQGDPRYNAFLRKMNLPE